MRPRFVGHPSFADKADSRHPSTLARRLLPRLLPPRGTRFAPPLRRKMIPQTPFLNYDYGVSSCSLKPCFLEAGLRDSRYNDALPVTFGFRAWCRRHAHESNFPVEYRREDHNFDWLGSTTWLCAAQPDLACLRATPHRRINRKFDLKEGRGRCRFAAPRPFLFPGDRLGAHIRLRPPTIRRSQNRPANGRFSRSTRGRRKLSL